MNCALGDVALSELSMNTNKFSGFATILITQFTVFSEHTSNK